MLSAALLYVVAGFFQDEGLVTARDGRAVALVTATTLDQFSESAVLYGLDLHTLELMTFWHAPKSGTAVAEVHVSPDGSHVAFTEQELQKARWTLRVLTSEGKERLQIESVYRAHSWSADSKTVAYLACDPAGASDSLPTSVCIVDLASGQSRRIHGPAVDLHWAAFDNRLYVVDFDEDSHSNRVIVFDAALERFTVTSHKGIGFSPEGQFYFVYDPELTRPLRLYSRADDSDITNLFPGLRDESLGCPRGWFTRESLVFKVGAGIQDETILDCASNKALNVKGRVVAILGDPAEVLVATSQTTFSRWRYDQLEGK